MSIDLLESFNLDSHTLSPRPLRTEGTSPVNRIVVEVYNAPEIIAELQQMERAHQLPQHLTRLLHQLVRGQQELPFPRPLVEIIGSKSLLSALRARLADIKNLAELITHPPPIFLDEHLKLFFYWGISVPLRPVSFNYLLLLARTPKEVVMREEIYRHLWPGEINYSGSNKPYEKQLSDHKRKLTAEVKHGVAGKMEIRAGEMEALIITRPKVGYMLNFVKENVVIIRKNGISLIILTFLFHWCDYFPDLLADLPELMILC